MKTGSRNLLVQNPKQNEIVEKVQNISKVNLNIKEH